tara:strand:- start:27 stop:473 length:447 start_codon:yes stop_codon:yes gene_type:complete
MDIWNRLSKWIDHNRYLVIALIIALAVNSYLFAMGSKTSSLINEGQRVNRIQLEGEIGVKTAELNAAITAFNAKVEAAVADLDEQDRIKAEIVEIVGGLATGVAGGGVGAPQIIATVLGIGGVLGFGGTMVDNRRKDKKIVELKNGSS